MKYGLITYKDTENIGDDIQSYVAIRFLPKIDYYIEREKLDLFVPKKEEQVVTIMNGWYLHSKINFYLSPFIYPIFISTHLSQYNNGGIKTEYLNEKTIKQLNEYGPIGCRDSGTKKLLDDIGVDNYLSGCLTLTIEEDKKVKKKDYICIVDIDEEAEKYLNDNLKDKKIVKKTHVLNREENNKLSWDERFKNVKELLDTYQAAELVITTRLHCALPCLALNTPVLLLYDEEKLYTKDRLADYAKIVNKMTTSEFLESGIEKIKSKIINPTNYLSIKEANEKRVKDFLKQAEKKVNNKSLPSIKDYQKFYVSQKQDVDNLYQIAVNDMETSKRDYLNISYERDYWKKEFEILLKKYEFLRDKDTSIEFNDFLMKYENLLKENKCLKEKLKKYEKRDKNKSKKS